MKTHPPDGSPQSLSLKKPLALSLGGHVFLALALLFFYTSDGFFLREKKVFTPSLKVELKALPEKISPKKAQAKKKARSAPVQKKPAPAPLKKPEIPKPPEPPPEKQPDPEKSDEEERTAENEKSVAEKTGGNKLSPGLDDGDPTVEDQIIFNEYIIEISERIKRNWKLPKYIMNLNLQAALEIKINSLGQVTEKKIISSSQNEIFDRQALKAIELSAPFPPPPESARDLADEGFIFQLTGLDAGKTETAFP